MVLPEPNGKQRSFKCFGNSGRKVISFGAQSVGGSISWTNEYVSTDDETEKKEGFMININNQTYSIELHFHWYSFENNKIQQLNYSDVELVVYYHPKKNKKCFVFLVNKRNLPLQIVFLW